LKSNLKLNWSTGKEMCKKKFNPSLTSWKGSTFSKKTWTKKKVKSMIQKQKKRDCKTKYKWSFKRKPTYYSSPTSFKYSWTLKRSSTDKLSLNCKRKTKALRITKKRYLILKKRLSSLSLRRTQLRRRLRHISRKFNSQFKRQQRNSSKASRVYKLVSMKRTLR